MASPEQEASEILKEMRRRFDRGEHGVVVGLEFLAMIAAGSLPSDHATVLAIKDIVRKSKAIAGPARVVKGPVDLTGYRQIETPNLSVELRATPLVPLGGLQAQHEGGPHRGHTIKAHVGRRFDELVDRLRSNSRLRYASSFANRSYAERAVSSVLKLERERMSRWLKTEKSMRLVLRSVDVGFPVGMVVTRGPHAFAPTKVTVVLVRDPTSAAGFRIFTAYPTL